MLPRISGLPLEALGVDAQRSLHNGSTACCQCLFSQREDVLALVVDDQLQMLQCRYDIVLLHARKVTNPAKAWTMPSHSWWLSLVLRPCSPPYRTRILRVIKLDQQSSKTFTLVRGKCQDAGQVVVLL